MIASSLLFFLVLPLVNGNLIRGGSISAMKCDSGAQRCGIVSVTMHKIRKSDKACIESCVMFPILRCGMNCGACPLASSLIVNQTTPLAAAPSSGQRFTPVVPSQSPSQSPESSFPSFPPAEGRGCTTEPSSIQVGPSTATAVQASDVSAGEGFSIQLQLVDIPVADQVFFAQAMERWESVIVGGLNEWYKTATFSRPALAHRDCIVPKHIDDMYICASYKTMDGPKGIVGLAGPLFYRKAQYNGSGALQTAATPIVGEMLFDIDDVDFLKETSSQDKASFLPTVMHEMGHILGIGTSWDDAGLVPALTVDKSEGPQSCPYNGTHANQEFQSILSAGNDSVSMSRVPLEQKASNGACNHWSEECLQNELMTGVLHPKSKPILSRITIGSLHDLGYTVDYSKADSYSHLDLGPQCSNRPRKQSNDGRGLAHDRASRQHRQLSKEGHQVAMNYGRLVLEDRQQKMERDLLVQYASDGSALTYKGDRVVSVLIREANRVYGVVVRSEL